MLWLALLVAAWPAAACPAAPMPSGATAVVPARGPDQALFTAAVLAEVNRLRCAEGRRALDPGPGLIRVAAIHSDWQAAARKLSHVSAVRGQRTLGPRLDAAGMAHRFGAENIAYLEPCGLSYADLARQVVAMWHGSPGHRRNMADARATMAGAGIARTRDGRCGYYMTLDLAG